MSDKLIRLDDVAKAITALAQEFIDGGSPTAANVLNLASDRINALPAVQPTPKVEALVVGVAKGCAFPNCTCVVTPPHYCTGSSLTIPAVQVGVKPEWLTNCAVCGRVVDTREASEGGDDHGCEYDNGWACSSECAETLSPDPDWMTVQPSPEVAALMEALVEQNDLLRSAFQIAKREGVNGEVASTNWDAYYNRVAVTLKRHHQTTNDARAALARLKRGAA